MPTKRRAPGDGSLTKRKSDGLWVGSVEIGSDDGKRRQKRVFSKEYKVAKQKLDELRADIRDGLVPISSTTTVAVWLRNWLDDIRKPHIRPNTYDYYDEAIRLHITPHIGNLRLAKLTPYEVRDMLKKIDTSANKVRAHKTLKQALKQATTDGLIKRNVVDAVDTPEHIKRVRGSLDFDQALLAIRTAIAIQESRDETEPMLATRYAAALLYGSRPAELVGLEWDRTDLDNGVLVLDWQLQQLDQVHGCGEPVDGSYPCARKKPGYCPHRQWDFEDGFEYRPCYKAFVWTRPKSGAGKRIVPIIPPLHAMLVQHQRATAAGPNPHNLVWHHTDGRPISRHDDGKAWRAILAAAELPPVELYSARHTTGTLLQELGVPEEVRMKIMGHSSVVAHQAYMHIDMKQLEAGLTKLGARILPS